MSQNLDKQKIDELIELVKNKEKSEPVEKVLALFCHRHGLDLAECGNYYSQLVKEGKIKEK